MTMNKKRVLKVLLVILLLIACIPFVPPIYNRFTKPLYNNYIDARLWYGKVDCEDLSQGTIATDEGIVQIIISW